MKRKRVFGFTLIELLVVVAIIALLISILLPSLSRARELSKRVVCSSNLSGLGKAVKIYANENEELWPVAQFNTGYLSPNTSTNRIQYVDEIRDDGGNLKGCTEDPTRSDPSCDKTNKLSTTRAFWMMVRAGDVQAKGFVCPSSGDTADPTNEIDAYYDFTAHAHISYGYHVPFGPRPIWPSENLDSRMAMAADKGPWYPNLKIPTGGPGYPNDSSSPNDWRAYNSSNHGGKGAGEGQNVLFHDGHVGWERTPIVGVDSDNIYTLMINNGRERYDRQIGKAPGDLASTQNPFPGDRTRGTTLSDYASTDSLIYP